MFFQARKVILSEGFYSDLGLEQQFSGLDEDWRREMPNFLVGGQRSSAPSQLNVT